ncbi:hypothetical protein Tco_0198756 [Tanacetum coccineum]
MVLVSRRRIFRQEIVRLHGTPTLLWSTRSKFTSRSFGKGLQKAWGKLVLSSAYSIFILKRMVSREVHSDFLEDMLRAVLWTWTGSWDVYLCLVSLPQNSGMLASWQTPFELLYGASSSRLIGLFEILGNILERFRMSGASSVVYARSRYSAMIRSLLPRNLNPFGSARESHEKQSYSFCEDYLEESPEREATWETEESMRASYPHFLSSFGYDISRKGAKRKPKQTNPSTGRKGPSQV